MAGAVEKDKQRMQPENRVQMARQQASKLRVALGALPSSKVGTSASQQSHQVHLPLVSQ